MINNLKFPHILFVCYIVLFLVLAINPYDRTVWLAENLPIVLIVSILVFLYQKNVRFSNTAYILMSFLIVLHTIGGHYTFARVPFDFITNILGFERNHYDRFAHFTVGFYAFAIAEAATRYKLTKNKTTTFFFSLAMIMAVAAGYEIFEWLFAVLGDPTAGIEVLGSQGDEWDAQKDMLLDTLGALVALALFFLKARLRTR
jgi:putative membrane protein